MFDADTVLLLDVVLRGGASQEKIKIANRKKILFFIAIVKMLVINKYIIPI